MIDQILETRSICIQFNPYPWILKKNPKRGTVAERVFRKKNTESSIASICICFRALDFFRKVRSVTVPSWNGDVGKIIFLITVTKLIFYFESLALNSQIGDSQHASPT